jgi:hypothetical protein
MVMDIYILFVETGLRPVSTYFKGIKHFNNRDKTVSRNIKIFFMGLNLFKYSSSKR